MLTYLAYNICANFSLSFCKIRQDLSRLGRHVHFHGSANSMHIRVLLVEDEPIIQKIHTKLLTQQGCQVDVASNGEEALTSYKAYRYDLILLDINLPDIDGFEISKQMRWLRHDSVPILAVSSEDSKIQPVCLRAGMNAFFSKPLSLEVVKNLLGRWLPWPNAAGT